MQALTISSHGGLDRLELRNDLPMPELRRPGDVRLRVRAAALNRLDLFVVEGLPGVTITPPWVLGADASGVIDAVGADVTTVNVGDHVVVNGGISDRTCDYCREGEQPLCPRFALLGEHLPGTLAEYLVYGDECAGDSNDAAVRGNLGIHVGNADCVANGRLARA